MAEEYLVLIAIMCQCTCYVEKTWLDCVKNDMENLGLSQKDALSRNKWRRRIKGVTG